MENNLTEKQEAVLNFIEEFQMNNGKSPTIREMKEFFQVKSDNSILKHLKALEEKGYIQKDDTPRGINLLDSVKDKLEEAKNSLKLPVFGFIPAGGPVEENDEFVDGYLSVGEDVVSSGKKLFALQVTGDSMIDAGIFEGDYVIADAEQEPKNGDIVVALIDNGNTLKRFIKEGNNVYLKAENKNYKDIYPINELYVQGVLKSLIRHF